MSLERRWYPSPNYSSRGGSGVRLIVIHTAEGATTIESLGNWFANPANQVSSHTGIDDKPNVVGEYVARGDKAWTAANANPYSIQTELCAFASWSLDEWNAHPVMLANCAAWIAEEAQAFGIPIVRLNASQAQSGGATGVCQHADLGAAGGGHWDCGPNFPLDRVLDMAVGGPQPEPEPEPAPPEEDDTDMALTICAIDGQGQQWVTDLATFKRKITSPAMRDQITWCVTAAGGKLYQTGPDSPVAVSAETLDGLPEIG